MSKVPTKSFHIDLASQKAADEALTEGGGVCQGSDFRNEFDLDGVTSMSDLMKKIVSTLKEQAKEFGKTYDLSDWSVFYIWDNDTMEDLLPDGGVTQPLSEYIRLNKNNNTFKLVLPLTEKEAVSKMENELGNETMFKVSGNNQDKIVSAIKRTYPKVKFDIIKVNGLTLVGCHDEDENYGDDVEFRTEYDVSMDFSPDFIDETCKDLNRKFKVGACVENFSFRFFDPKVKNFVFPC